MHQYKHKMQTYKKFSPLLITALPSWTCPDEKKISVPLGYLGKGNEQKFRGNPNKHNLDENDSHMKYTNIGYKMTEVDELDVNPLFRAMQVI